MALALWVIASCLWYYAYWWFVPVTPPTFLLTFLVIPAPFLVHRVISMSRRATGQPKLQRLFGFIERLIAVLLVAGLSVLGLSRLITGWYAQPRVFSMQDVPQKQVAIVFGAGLMRDGSLTPELSDRVATAANLYFAGKAAKLLMSGDNRFVNYNEPEAMRKYALRLGVPDGAIVLDYAGRRTYDTCYRARDIFEARDVILVTQQYHLPRALYTCNALGVNAIGIPAERGRYPHLYGNLREFPATLSALWEVHISHPLPILGKPEPIFLHAYVPSGLQDYVKEYFSRLEP